MRRKQDDKARDVVFQFRIDLVQSQPLIWRRALVTADSTLEMLHMVIQMSLGWQDEHLHQFEIRGGRFGEPTPSGLHAWLAPVTVTDESEVRLVELALTPGTRFRYTYDFGDNWNHELELEAILERDPTAQYPACTEAVGAGPPEDVGGLWGYYDMLEALADANHEDHWRYADWIGGEGEWDPERVDIDDINRRLALMAGRVGDR